MATATHQRVTIWIIAIVMVIGTLGTYFVMILANDNGAVTSSQELELQKQLEEYQKQQEEAQKANRPLEGYEATPFDKAAVTELKVETLKQGEGTAATAQSTVNANYFGWTSDGAIFDSTNKNGTVTPIDFSLQGVIPGWTEGLTGVKQGSVVKLTIPAAKAYGESGSGSIGPNEPLTFIVELKEVK